MSIVLTAIGIVLLIYIAAWLAATFFEYISRHM